MSTPEIRILYPVSWVCESKIVMDYLQRRIFSREITDDFLIADFASGENDRIPNFIHRFLRELIQPEEKTHLRRIVTYSTDLHGLRLDSLYGMFEEQDLNNLSRAVHARLENMVTDASFRQDQADYLREHIDEQNELDGRILKGRGIGEGVFDLGFLDTDVVGYLFEYYKAYTDAIPSLESVYKTMRYDALLIVTQPCLFYPVDNIEVLESVGFNLVDGIDIETKTGTARFIGGSPQPDELSRMGHYTFFVFRKN